MHSKNKYYNNNSNWSSTQGRYSSPTNNPGNYYPQSQNHMNQQSYNPGQNYFLSSGDPNMFPQGGTNYPGGTHRGTQGRSYERSYGRSDRSYSGGSYGRNTYSTEAPGYGGGYQGSYEHDRQWRPQEDMSDFGRSQHGSEHNSSHSPSSGGYYPSYSKNRSPSFSYEGGAASLEALDLRSLIKDNQQRRRTVFEDDHDNSEARSSSRYKRDDEEDEYSRGGSRSNKRSARPGKDSRRGVDDLYYDDNEDYDDFEDDYDDEAPPRRSARDSSRQSPSKRKTTFRPKRYQDDEPEHDDDYDNDLEEEMYHEELSRGNSPSRSRASQQRPSRSRSSQSYDDEEDDEPDYESVVRKTPPYRTSGGRKHRGPFDNIDHRDEEDRYGYGDEDFYEDKEPYLGMQKKKKGSLFKNFFKKKK